MNRQSEWSIEISSDEVFVIDVMMDSLVCQIKVNDDFYEISTPYVDWKQYSRKLWELEDEKAICFVDMLDECIGEIERMLCFVKKNVLFKAQIEKAQLQIRSNWRGDIRPKLAIMMEPLIEGSEYYLVNNYTDTKKQILELHKKGINKRLLGFSGKMDTSIAAFFNKGFYDQINTVIELPENRLPNKTQPHVTLTVEQLWNVICVAVGKKQYIVEI